MSFDLLKTLKACLLLTGLFLFNSVAHAQAGPCPEGMSQYPSPNGVPTCGPMVNQSPARPAWGNDQWGAIATEGPHGSYGATTHFLSRKQAEQAALNSCAKTASAMCHIAISYYNECVAMVIGNNTQIFKSAPYAEKAAKWGINKCSKDGDSNCRVIYSACSHMLRSQ